MRIGLDLDGVLYDFVACSRLACELYYPDHADHGDFDAEAVDYDYYEKQWGMSAKEFWDAFRAFEHGFYSQPLHSRWYAFFSWAVHAGHTVHVVTARSMHRVNTMKWLAKLEEYGITFDSVHFARDKSLVDVDVLIDDATSNINAWVDTGKAGIVWNQPWNRDCYRATYRVRNVTELMDRINHLAENGLQQESVLDEANRLVNGARNKDYGHPIEDFSRTAGMWSALWGLTGERALGPEDVALAMTCVKLSREKNKAKRDNAVDIAGYAQTLAMVRDEQGAYDA